MERIERPPAGADSAAVAAWLDAQRRACRGDLVVMYDEGAVHDSAGGGFRYRSFLRGAACRTS